MRSPLAFASSFKCPVRAYLGDREQAFVAPTERLAQQARNAGLDVRAETVPGDHFSHVAEAMRRSIEFFHSRE